MARLDGELSRAGLGTRREVKELIRSGRVAVDGDPVRLPDFHVNAVRQHITLDGQPIAAGGHLHLLMHKPAGVVTAARDQRHDTVMDLVPLPLRRPGLQPVGRLDKDTTGALVLTTDGELAHRLLSPRRHVTKVYRVTLARPLPAYAAADLASGLRLGDGTRCLPAVLHADVAPHQVRLEVHEGKFHLVKRMMAALGSEVVELHRERFGPATLPANLAGGAVRQLTLPEIAALYAAVDLPPPTGASQ